MTGEAVIVDSIVVLYVNQIVYCITELRVCFFYRDFIRDQTGDLADGQCHRTDDHL